VITRARRLLLVGIVSAAAIAGASTLAAADMTPQHSVTAIQQAADSLPPFAVEDFEYPNAAKILQEKGITLKRGDGHIILADCTDATDQLHVWTRESADGKFCFRTTATTGYLTLELPEVYGIQTRDQTIRAELSAEGTTQTVDVPKNDFKGVGEGTGGAPTVLLELRVTG
jgi:hypothetical protein